MCIILTNQIEVIKNSPSWKYWNRRQRHRTVFLASYTTCQLNHQYLKMFLYKDWRHLSDIPTKHEFSNQHKKSSWVGALRLLKLDSTIDVRIHSRPQKEKIKLRNILNRILEVIRLLASHNLAFLESSCQLFKQDNENFLGIVQLLAILI